MPITPVCTWPVMLLSAMPFRRLRTMRMDNSTPSMLPLPPKNRYPTEEHHGDDIKLEANGGISPHGAKACGIKQPGERGDNGRHHEKNGLHPLHLHAGIARHIRTVADNKDQAAEPRAVQDHTQQDQQHNKDDQRQWKRANHRLLAKVIHPLRKVSEAAIFEEYAGEPAKANEHRQRDHKGGNAKPGDQKGV